MDQKEPTAIDLIGSSITLPCGLTLPNRLIKCPMQETLALPPSFDPPVEKWRNIYKTWAISKYGMLITGQVQVDIRFLSVPGDVCVHEGSLSEPVMAKWKEWAEISQSGGTPCIVQIAHPGRMSPAGAGVRPSGMPALCPSSVPVRLGDTFLDKLALDKILGTPRAMKIDEIDEAVANFKRAAIVSRDAGFAGIQLHGAHGFLISQFLSPHTNRRTDEYGGSPENRLRFLQRLVKEIREECPKPFCIAVKLNSGDYMAEGGLSQHEALDQVKWLIESEKVDFIEISGGNAEQSTSKLHGSFNTKSLSQAPTLPPQSSTTRLREAFFTEFAERIQTLQLNKPNKIPIQLSGGFRSRAGMADAILSGVCDLIGLGRPAVLEPSLPIDILLNPSIPDSQALGTPHVVRGLWMTKLIPAKVVGSGLGIQFFYWNMRRLGDGLDVMPDASVLYVTFMNVLGSVKSMLVDVFGGMMTGPAGRRVKND